MIAFVGLAVCGLLAAALGGYGERRIASLSAAAAYRDLLHSAAAHGDAAVSVDSRLTRALEAVARAYPVAAAVVRDVDDRVVATRRRRVTVSDRYRSSGWTPTPSCRSTATGARARQWDPILPPEGGRIALSAGPERTGWLDVWGDGRPANAAARLALSDLARLIALLLAGPRYREGRTPMMAELPQDRPTVGRELQARFGEQRSQGLKAASRRWLALSSIPVWIQVGWGVLPDLVAFWCVLLQGGLLVSTVAFAALESRWRARAAGIEAGGVARGGPRAWELVGRPALGALVQPGPGLARALGLRRLRPSLAPAPAHGAWSRRGRRCSCCW